jgi:hypothetical protein
VNTNPAKVYVDVLVSFDTDGNMHPTLITWEGGKPYPIDSVLDITPAAAMKSGGQGDRYTVKILGKQSYLFFERSPKISGCNLGKWFVERKN